MPQPTNPWKDIFKHKGRVFTELHEAMPGILRFLEDRQAKTILDLGCGSGRHTVYFAQHGFSVYGLDSSLVGIRLAGEWLNEEGLQANLELQSMTDELPYEDDFFDAVVSIQVIHHARIAIIRGIIQEIFRILKVGGFLFITVSILRPRKGRFIEIEPNTFIPLDGQEKGLPHHRFSPGELREAFTDFEISGIHIDKQEHYCLSAFKP